MDKSLVSISHIRNELNIKGDIRVWAEHLDVNILTINKRNYCTYDDYLKLKEFYSQPNLKEVKLKLMNDKRKRTCQERYGGNSPMSSSDVQDKIKKTYLKKYGVDSIFKNKEIKEKISKTFMNKYGTNVIAHIPGVKEKKRKTCLEKYGVEYSCQAEQMITNSKLTKLKRYGSSTYNNREKCKQTCLEKYGEFNVTQNSKVKEKGRKTCLEKYGVEYYTQTQDMKDKSAKTCLKKYGVKKPSQSKEIQQKIKQTLFNHYGVEHPLQSNELLRKSHKKWKVAGLDNVNFASKEEAYYYIYLKDNDYNFEYQVEYPIPYKDGDGKEHIFIVDFKVDDKYVEIKGDQFFDSEGNAQFIYNQNDINDNLKRLSMWKSKLEIIKNNDDIELILSSTFDKNGKNFYMTKHFYSKYQFIKQF